MLDGSTLILLMTDLAIRASLSTSRKFVGMEASQALAGHVGTALFSGCKLSRVSFKKLKTFVYERPLMQLGTTAPPICQRHTSSL